MRRSYPATPSSSPTTANYRIGFIDESGYYLQEYYDNARELQSAAMCPLPEPPCISGQGDASVWFTLLPKQDLLLSVDTFDSDYDTVLAVWEGTPGQLSNHACNDNADSSIQLPLELRAGWNMAAYLPQSALPIPEALSSIEESLKDRRALIYWPAQGINQIGDMLPGAGYQLCLTAPGTLIYPDS